MHNFIRPNAASAAEVDANLLVTEIVELLRPEIERAGIEASLDLAVDAARISADAIQIQQVLVNLVQNAIQAMNCRPPDERGLALRPRWPLPTPSSST